jgi:hypothetical protein
MINDIEALNGQSINFYTNNIIIKLFLKIFLKNFIKIQLSLYFCIRTDFLI